MQIMHGLAPTPNDSESVVMVEPLENITNIGVAYGRYKNTPFGIKQTDRQFHCFMVGQTGTGKSTLLHNLILQDAWGGNGLCLIEPHGDLAEGLRHHLDDNCLYWDVADPTSPYGYNPLTRVSPEYRPLVASGLIDALKKQWADAWGVRMEHLLRYAVLALLEQPQANMGDIPKLFVERSFRNHVINRINDAQVRYFWTQEYRNMNYKNAADGFAPIGNKLGAFLAHPVVRRAICEPEKPLRFRKIMDEGTVLIINLAKGKLGADTANVLGGMIASSIMNAAFSRHDTPERQRRPFYLYVDEFHSFATTAFADMLSEVRKFGLGLILSQQYAFQIDRSVFEAVIGNVGSMIVFRIGLHDSPLFSRQLETVTEHDLINLPNYQAFVRLMVDGRRTDTFSASTYPPISNTGRIPGL